MNKKILIATTVVLALALAGFGGYYLTKQKTVSEKVYHVGILDGYDFFGKTTDGFEAGMAGLGYIEGKNIIYDVVKANVSAEEYNRTLQKFANEKVDLIVAYPTEASMEAKKTAMTTGIPLVFTTANVEGVDLINSIKEPGNNLTGVRYPGPDIALKRLELMLEILPKAKNILIPYDKNYPNVPPQLETLRQWAPALNVNLIEAPVAAPEELQNFLDSLKKKGQKVDAIVTIAEAVSATPVYVDIFGKFAEDNKIPLGGTLLLKENGYDYESLYGVSVNDFAVGQKAAVLADKIFKGTPAGIIPVESAEMYIEINYKKAVEMGISLSEGFLGKANRIIR